MSCNNMTYPLPCSVNSIFSSTTALKLQKVMIHFDNSRGTHFLLFESSSYFGVDNNFISLSLSLQPIPTELRVISQNNLHVITSKFLLNCFVLYAKFNSLLQFLSLMPYIASNEIISTDLISHLHFCCVCVCVIS